jgi:hypothetical protein
MDRNSDRRRVLVSAGLCLVLILACNAPAGISEDSRFATALAGTQTSRAADAENAAAATEEPPSAPEAAACEPEVTATMDVNVRGGPGSSYGEVGALFSGESAKALGWNEAHTWWNIEYAAGPGGRGWVWGQAVSSSCIPADLAVIPVAPAAPAAPAQEEDLAEEPAAEPETADDQSWPFLQAFPIGPLVAAGNGDLQLTDVFLSTGDEILLQVNNDSHTLSGTFTYQVRINGSLAVTRTVTVPAGSQVFWSSQHVSGEESVEVSIDTGNAFFETDEGNNSMSVTCSSSANNCW